MNLDLSRVLMNQKTEINKGDFKVYENNISFNKIFGNLDDIKNSKDIIKKYTFDDKVMKNNIFHKSDENKNNFKEKKLLKM